ncbi:MAG: ABC transporter permease [Candidatus Dormibacteraceae bacterium]
MSVNLSAAAPQLGTPAAGDKSVGLWRDAGHRLLHNRVAMIAAGWLLLVLLVALISTHWTPYPMAEEGLADPYSGPTWSNLLGADDLGRDILSRLMVGAQISLLVGVGTQLIVVLVGVTLGLLAGYFRGPFDTALSLVINIFYGIPDILLALILVTLLGRSGLGNIILAIALTRWMDVARLTRGQALSLRQREFVEAARSCGSGPFRIISRHILPNALGPIIVQATLGIPQAILFEAFLSFLGLGVPPPTPSWGAMAADGISALRLAPELVLAPSIALSVTLMAFNFLGDGLRDALDPRQRR